MTRRSPVLAPGAGKTKTGRLWVYLRDERPHAGTAPPAVLYRYTPDRKGEHCRAELANFTGWLHADGYAGFGRLYEIAGATIRRVLLHGPPRVAEVGCWSHVRRGFFDEWASHKSTIAKEALDRIGALFDIERPIAGQPPDIRRAVRQRTARPRIDELAIWLDAQLKKIPGKSDLAGAIRYARSRWPALTRYLDDGRLEISNNAAENQIRPVSFGQKKLVVLRLATPAASARPRSTRSSAPPGSTASSPRPGSPTSSPASAPSDQPARTSCCPGTGSHRRRKASPPEPASSSGKPGSPGLSLTLDQLLDIFGQHGCSSERLGTLLPATRTTDFTAPRIVRSGCKSSGTSWWFTSKLRFFLRET